MGYDSCSIESVQQFIQITVCNKCLLVYSCLSIPAGFTLASLICCMKKEAPDLAPLIN